MVKWTFLLSFVVSTAVLLALGWLGYERIHMNGCLCRAHAHLEKSCAACHRPWQANRVGKAMCASDACHPSILKETVHVSPAVNVACDQCHIEHHGRDCNLNVAQVNWLCEECHAKDVAGANHKFIFDCYNCHYYHYPSPHAPPVERNFANMKNPHGDHLEAVTTLLKLAEGDATCRHCHGSAEARGAVRSASHDDCLGSECHQNTDRTKPSRQCTQCHTLCERTRKTGIKFSHAGHTKDKIKVGCDECHIVKSPDSTFVKVNVEFCIECHNVKHDKTKDIASKDCAYCHTTPDPVEIAHLKFRHEEHVDIACGKCHKDMRDMMKLTPLRMMTAGHCGTCHIETGIRVP